MATFRKIALGATAMLGLASICGGQIAPSSGGPIGVVLIHVKDAYGYEVKPGEAKVTITSQSGIDFSPRDFNGSVSLPFGRYALRVNVAGFITWRGELNVSGPQTRITVGMLIGGLEAPKPTCALSGQVVGAGGREAWVRLMPLFADENLEADLSLDGRFQFDGAECGDYILAVIGSDKVLKSLYVRLKHEPNTISVRLGPEQ